MKKILLSGLLAVIAIPSLAFASIDANLKYGSRGTEVVELQEFLISKGLLSGTATGNFFSLTKAAVISYQKAKNITPATGFVGLITRGKINSELALDNSQEIAETGTTTPPKQTSTHDLLKQQNDLLKQQLQAQQQIIQNTTPTPPPQPPALPTISIGEQTCGGQTSKRMVTVKGDNWDFGITRLSGWNDAHTSNYDGGHVIHKGNPSEASFEGVDSGTYNYSVKLYHIGPNGLQGYLEQYAILVTSKTGQITFTQCGNVTPPTPPTPPTPSAAYHPLTIGSYVANNACVSKGESGTFENIYGTLVTIGLNGTTTSPITLQPTNSISITASSPQALGTITFSQAGLYEYSFAGGGSGTHTISNIGTGGELSKAPIIVRAGWSGQEVPTTLELTINSIKFADGTEVGGLPMTISGLGITKCSWSN